MEDDEEKKEQIKRDQNEVDQDGEAMYNATKYSPDQTERDDAI